MRQVEFYLSESNLRRDHFFRQEAEKRPDNGILIDSLLKCNRLQQMQATRGLLIRALKKSSLVQLSDDGDAVIRCYPLTDLGPPEKRTVLVTGLPRWSHEPGTAECLNPLPEQGIQEACSTSILAQPSNQLLSLMDWLYDVLGEFGRVLHVNIPRYHSSSMLRGFAFVEFSNRKEAKAAIKNFFPNDETESWFVSPSPSAGPVSHAAWTPRMAAKASFRPEDMLARRYIWRCCSRRNKQIISAFRHLRAAGYRAPNPCDREYELITLGANSEEMRTQHLRDCYGEPVRERLRVFCHSEWEFWKSKFYTWLRGWIERMNRKTEELSLDVEQVATDPNGDTQETYSRSHGEACITKPPSEVALLQDPAGQPTTDSLTNDFESQKEALRLPKNYVPGAVVLIFWPSVAVSDADQIVPLSSTPEDQVPVPKPTLSLTRRIRLSIEQYLSECGLLNEVAHFDSQPSDLTLSSVLTTLDSCSESPSDIYPVFIRMKSSSAARQLCDYFETLILPPSSQPVRVKVLPDLSEIAYWSVVSKSTVGAAERRRLVQLRRRKRKRRPCNHAQPDDQVDPSSSSFSKRFVLPLQNRCIAAQHIVFDE
ncbi:unnamed protein product [Dicrocoelium dendriticum]|nr:unnamed protein product [Dicrocoelium dendriticum]